MDRVFQSVTVTVPLQNGDHLASARGGDSDSASQLGPDGYWWKINAVDGAPLPLGDGCLTQLRPDNLHYLHWEVGGR